MHPLKAYFKRKFQDPVIYANIAKLLREGYTCVKVKYRNRCHTRYYTGSGQVTNSSWGVQKRWNVHVEYFDDRNENKEYHINPSKYVWFDPNELKLVQDYGWDNVESVTMVKPGGSTADEIVKVLHDLSGKLRPGQGYLINNYYITNDLYGESGYKFRNQNGVWFVPSHLITLQDFIGKEFDDTFDTEKVFVADQKVIKRQHRRVTDIRRWYECKQVPSVLDRHAITFTPKNTGIQPVFYYDVIIKIDDPSRKGYPFYVEDIVEDALTQLGHSKSVFDISRDYSAIMVEWDGELMPLKHYMSAADKYPVRLDTHPILKLRA